MVEDLLSRIEQELYGRMEELYPVVEECDRLRADLRALEAFPELPVEAEPPTAVDIDLVSPAGFESPPAALPAALINIDLESPAGFESPAALEVEPEPPYRPEPPAALTVDPDPSGTVLRFPANRRPTRTVAVAPQASRPISTLFRPASAPASVPAGARVVSPKVARLMLAPRRPALERSGIPRVSASA